ncbi:MAG: patatin-like phospholipase family protein [Roseateles asaccharophilus]|uniref:NTE family protein/lysophospholipid hydrolase n=1 Tax=Roseateles asaccharophilus TaxID=582607 RepID=A0A4R6NET7_9BURK|nr:patatin-like phospholipase family protein [Roseateles asaccharophilus]MDN3544869.1 patatin-like phospholipase family protein [Roseateles asaccharophilus]TDP12744.1 NTE family protein/lysophospholipid hydrolase [Roseateles asaccharophilus]
MHNAPSPSDQERFIAVLREDRIFGELPSPLLERLAARMQLRQVPGGSAVYAEGDASDSFVFVISGALRCWRRGARGELLLYNELHPGQSVGELSMIMEQRRAQHVTALRDATIAVLSREAFEDLLRDYPLPLSRSLVRAVAERLRGADGEGEKRRMSQSFLLLPLEDSEAARQAVQALAQDLVLALRCLGTAMALSAGRDAEHLSVDGQELGLSRLADLDDGHDFLVYAGEAGRPDWTRLAFRHADQLILVGMDGGEARPTPLELGLREEPGWNLKRQHLVLLHAPAAARPDELERWRQDRLLERTYPIRRGHAGDAGRLARFLTSRAIGLVLGGGGARGFAHLGVLRAFEEQGLPVDLIGGNSMGALIGAQLALGSSLDEILSQTRRFAAGGERLTLPLVSLVGGQRVQRDLQALFGELRIEQLWRPYFAAACNLSRGQTEVLDQGPLWQAVLASNSPAGLFPPVLRDGELLVDGAILDNVPVAAMRARLGTPLERRRGNGTVLAIDVDQREDLRADARLDRLGPGARLRSLGSAQAPRAPGIADILYAAGHIGGATQRPRTLAQADVFLSPDVREFALMAYQRAEEIAERGYRHALEQQHLWQPLIPARPTAP